MGAAHLNTTAASLVMAYENDRVPRSSQYQNRFHYKALVLFLKHMSVRDDMAATGAAAQAELLFEGSTLKEYNPEIHGQLKLSELVSPQPGFNAMLGCPNKSYSR